MDTNAKVKIGIIGSQFQADIHATSLQIMPHEAELVAVASPTPGNAEHFAKRFNIPRAYTDYREMLKDPAIEVIKKGKKEVEGEEAAEGEAKPKAAEKPEKSDKEKKK